MAVKGLQQYNEKESGNASLGMGGSMFMDDTSIAYKPPSGKIFIAIQVLDAVQFDASSGLVSENNDLFINTEGTVKGAAHPGATTNDGNQIDASNTFPVGTIIYGRWTQINLAAGSGIAYIGA